MVEITLITQAQFEAIPRGEGGRPRSPLHQAMIALELGEGLQVHCRWTHSGQCHGTIGVRNFAKTHGFKVRTRCQNDILSVLRV